MNCCHWTGKSVGVPHFTERGNLSASQRYGLNVPAASQYGEIHHRCADGLCQNLVDFFQNPESPSPVSALTFISLPPVPHRPELQSKATQDQPLYPPL